MAILARCLDRESAVIQEFYRLMYALLKKEFEGDIVDLEEGKYDLTFNGRTYQIMVWSFDTAHPRGLQRLGDLPNELVERIERTIRQYAAHFPWNWNGGHLQCLTEIPFEVGFLEVR